jgi:hypothetical protein
VERIVVRLSVDVFADGKYTIWAIPVSLRDRRKAERARWRAAADQERDARRGGRSSGAFGGAPVRTDPQAPLADQAYQELESRRAACRDEVDDVAPVTATWTWQSFAALAVAALLITLAAVLG